MLNRELYDRLMKVTKGKVKISSENEPFVYRPDPRDPKKIMTVSGGEYYRICCPQCADDKFRLWINHRYGTMDDIVTKRPMWHLAVCYHNPVSPFNPSGSRCSTDWLKDELQGIPTTMTATATAVEQPMRGVETPGMCIPFPSLAPEHIAKRYLREVRRINIDWLQANYPVAYCAQAHNKSVSHRIVFSVYDEAGWQGFQARAPFDPSPEPKWYTARGFKKSRFLFNLPRAASTGLVILTEGILDALACGIHGVCSFGKTLSMPQAELLSQRMRFAGTVVIAYDNDAAEWTRAAYEILRPVVNRVERLDLPMDTDPGDLGWNGMQTLLKEKLNITLEG